MTEEKKCPDCGGRGHRINLHPIWMWLTVYFPGIGMCLARGPGKVATPAPCKTCGGTGKINK